MTMLQNSDKIGGPGKTVQIDESKVGKRKYHRGHRVEGQWVFGGIEEDTRKCFLVPVEDRSEATLLPIIREWIEPGTLIVSDCWKSYCCWKSVFYGKLTRTTIPKILPVSLLTTKEHPYRVKKNLQGSFFIIYEKLKNRLFHKL